ncbi:stage V sporulation protein AD [Lachnospiraceae bacterium HCP1S3_C3]|nr:stage V sporulation protein AD [Lachnospiraceae bacterium]MDD6857154.1 stage V sporulation protein AD [Lachnospiraceae bacterium]
MSQKVGKQSIAFENGVYIDAMASIVGKKEGNGPLGHEFDMIVEDPKFGEDNWDAAESKFQNETAKLVISKSGLAKESIRYIFAGDLLGQLIATTFGIAELGIPLFGLYGACSTMGESISLGAMTVAAGYADYVMALASSHFASAEKSFRFPLEYSNQRPYSATWTVTGCGSVIIGKDKGIAKIEGITTGKIVDYGIKDAMNMGACMAPAAADVIYNNLKDFHIEPDYYDKIITGDLGYVGQTILIDMLKERGIDISDRHYDCGIEIFDNDEQDTHSGGSGCGCSASVLCSYILKQLEKGYWKRILFVPTGALMSPISFNEGQSIPGIAHAVVLASE